MFDVIFQTQAQSSGAELLFSLGMWARLRFEGRSQDAEADVEAVEGDEDGGCEVEKQEEAVVEFSAVDCGTMDEVHLDGPRSRSSVSRTCMVPRSRRNLRSPRSSLTRHVRVQWSRLI